MSGASYMMVQCPFSTELQPLQCLQSQHQIEHALDPLLLNVISSKRRETSVGVS